MIKKILMTTLCIVMIINISGCGKKMASSEVYLLNFKPEVSEVYEEIAKVSQKWVMPEPGLETLKELARPRGEEVMAVSGGNAMC